MRILSLAGMLCCAGLMVASATVSVSSAPLPMGQANVTRVDPVAVHRVGWHHAAVWHGWRWSPYVWRDVYDDACSGDHPPWSGAYAGYPIFWCSPGFGAYNRHWPQ
ncbi:hypothetical protein ACQR1W_03585 [Bradyrhizobium sp. HKCCYLS1011]|uniref:hypothetical protein n=1 Tax=Bradyrhizobium sp. HKCCYLS1011 TaxID=3420733 RepID=UPI003EBC797D